VKSFIRRPHWLGLADHLANLADDELASGDELLLAHLAMQVSLSTHWATPEEAYWHAMIQASPVGRYGDVDELDVVEPAERCRVVARWVIDAALTDGPRTDRGGTLSPREAARALDSLAELESSAIDPGLWRQEMESARARPLMVIDRPTARRLAALSRLAGYRQDSRWHDELFALVTGTRIDEMMRRSVRLAREWCTGGIGLWLAGPHGGRGWCIWDGGAEDENSQIVEGTREAVESSHLPAVYRCSLDLLTQEDRLIGRLYSDHPIQGPLADRWLGRLASALGAFWERGGKEAVHPIPVTTTEKNRDAIAKKVRRAIGEFSAGAGHEINNPLGAIAGHAARLLKDEVVPERRHALQQIHQQVARVRQMIRDLQLIGGNLSLTKLPVDLASVMTQASREAQKRLNSGHLVLRSCPEDWQVVGDRDLLTRMLTELLVNGGQAAGPLGEVAVWAERSAEGSPAIEVVVRDSGPGLTSSQRQRAFIPFYSGREAGRGLGMGLPVAERIALEHGGTIFISSGKPTTVRVQLPVGLKRSA
jgi:signal transduction histidine kinase